MYISNLDREECNLIQTLNRIIKSISMFYFDRMATPICVELHFKRYVIIYFQCSVCVCVCEPPGIYTLSMAYIHLIISYTHNFAIFSTAYVYDWFVHVIS